MKRKFLPFLGIAVGALFLSSCGMLPSRGLKPGKLPRGGAAIGAEELAERFFDSIDEISLANHLHGSLNLEEMNYYVYETVENSQAKQTGETSVSASGKVEYGMNNILSSNADDVTGYVKASGVNFKYDAKAEMTDKTTEKTESEEMNYNYSKMALEAYLNKGDAYINVENESLKSLIIDLSYPDATDEQKETYKNSFPGKILVEEVLASGGSGVSSDVTFDFEFTEEDKLVVVQALESVKEIFGDSISYLAYGEKGYGVAFSLSQDKIYNSIYNSMLEEAGRTEDSLTEEEKEYFEKMKKEFYDMYKFNSLKTSIYYDVDNKKVESAVDVNIEINSKSSYSDVESTSKVKVAVKASSSTSFVEKEINFPSDLNSYIPVQE